MKKHLQFRLKNNEVVNYIFWQKNIKRMWMKLNKNNEIVISAPLNINQKDIDNFIEQNIEKFFIESKKNSTKKNFINFENKTFILFGQNESFELLGNDIILIDNVQLKIKKNNIKKTIEDYCSKELFKYIEIKQKEFENIMNIEHHEIAIKNKSSAWATNYVSKKKINYSINLFPFSFTIIDYVIIHELSHNKYPNHSIDFWNYVEQYEPNYKILRDKLKKNIL